MTKAEEFDSKFNLDLSLFKDGNYYQYKNIPVTSKVSKMTYFYFQRVNKEKRCMCSPDYLYLAFESCGGHFIGMSEDLDEIKGIMWDHHVLSCKINTPPEGCPLD